MMALSPWIPLQQIPALWGPMEVLRRMKACLYCTHLPMSTLRRDVSSQSSGNSMNVKRQTSQEIASFFSEEREEEYAAIWKFLWAVKGMLGQLVCQEFQST